jgi:hypothetical protein
MTDVILFHHAQGLTQGDQHLFADRSLPSYDEAAAALLTEPVLAFLAGLAA